MATIVRKGLIGQNDIKFYSAASPTFSRVTSTGGATNITAFCATLTYAGFRNVSGATNIQAAASNQYLANGCARVVLPVNTYTAATAINLPKKTWIFGSGRGSIVRASGTNQTSRVFSISGSIGATTSNLNCNATIGTQNVSVADGTKFAKGQWILVEDSINKELQQIISISSNTLKVCGRLGNTYRSAATTKRATIAYPAELVMDNFDIQLTSATQGIGVAATYLVRSIFGPNLRIVGAANSGVTLSISAENQIGAQVVYPSSDGSGKGYGVRLTNYSHDNVIAGIRDGTTKDVADGKAVGNWVWGSFDKNTSIASGVPNPLGWWYRNNKPELGYATYGATTVVTCPASATVPAEVYINGRVYQNRGTVLCDLSRTKVPTSATVCGLDRGPAAATSSYYIYAVPSVLVSATRQFDLIASTGNPGNTGPTAIATYPQWSFLGAVPTMGATVRLCKFTQTGNDFHFWDSAGALVTLSSPISAMATWRQARAGRIPIGTNKIYVRTNFSWNAKVVDANYNGSVFILSHGDAQHIVHGMLWTSMTSYSDAASGALSQPDSSNHGWVSLNSNRFFSYRVTVAATANAYVYLYGYSLQRNKYK